MATFEVDTDIIEAKMQEVSEILNEVANSKNMFEAYSTTFRPDFMQNWVNKTYNLQTLEEDAQSLETKIKEYLDWMGEALQAVVNGDLQRAEQYNDGENLGAGAGGGPSGSGGSSGGGGSYQPVGQIESPGLNRGTGTGYASYSYTGNQLLYGPGNCSYSSYCYSSKSGGGSYSYTGNQLLYGPAPSYSYSSITYPYTGNTYSYTSKPYSYTSNPYSYSSYSYSYPGYSYPGSGGYSSGGGGGYSSGSSVGSSLVDGPYGPYDPNNLYDPNNPNSPYYKGNTSGTGGAGTGSSTNKADGSNGLAGALGKGLSGISNARDALSRTNDKLSSGLSSGGKGLGLGGALNPMSMAGIGLAAGGAIAGAGLLLGSKRNYVFDPEDWDSLDEDTQNSILFAMDAVGFEQTDIDLFANSTFVVPRSEIDPHEDNIKEASEVDMTLSKEIHDVYGFTCMDEEDKVDKYLLFIILSLDGVKFDDNYNLYNILNGHLDEESVDFTYSGINMFEYLKDEDELDEESSSDEDIDYNNLNLDETEA